MKEVLPSKFHKRDYDIRKDAFLLVLHLMFVLSLYAFILYLFIDETEPEIFSAIVVTLVFSILEYASYLVFKQFNWLSMLLVVYINVFLLPVFITYSTIMRGSMPIWFAAGLLVIFFLLDYKRYGWIIPVLIYWDVYVFVRNLILSDVYFQISGIKQFTASVIVALVSAVMALVFVIILQERKLDKEKKAIDESRESIKSAGVAKARFLANMSHEIRTPMNSIIGLSELILKDDMDDATRQEATLIKDSAYDLLDIIDDVLIYSKLDSGKLSLKLGEFSFADMIKGLLESISAPVFDKKLKMRIMIDHNIPKVLLGDDIQIRQIFARLIFISLSLTENGRIMINIGSQRDEANNKVRINCIVADTGCGLAQADLDAIYGAYDTYDSRQNSNLKGLGLKFSICRELLKLMNGTINVKSIEGVGLETTFSFECDIKDPSPMISLDDKSPRKVLIYITDNRELSVWKTIMEGFELRPDYVNSAFAFEKAVKNIKYDYIFVPSELYSDVSSTILTYKIEESTYVVADSKKTYGDFDKCRIIYHPVSCIGVSKILNNRWNPIEFSSKAEKNNYDGSKAKILVVDDNGVNLKVACSIFKQYKIEADIAKSGEECLNKMAMVKYHMVLMDMVMPEMSGLETLIKIRESEHPNFKDVPVIALTASTGANIRDEILAQGFQEYLAKPIKKRYLTNILVEFLPSGILKVVKEEEKKENRAIDLTKEDNVLVTAKGIANIGYNEDSYCAILNTYYSEGMRKIKLLPDLLEAGNIELFTTDVHGIKSSSASIGAMTVSLMFKELEFAGKDNNVEYIRLKYDLYVEAFIKILGDVKEYLLSKNKFEYVEDTQAADLTDSVLEELTTDMLNEFKGYIDSMNLKAGDAFIDSLKNRNFGASNEAVSKLIKSYEMFDFHEVKVILNSLLGIS